MEKIKNFRLGKNAQKVLLFCLPLMVFAAFVLTVGIALADSVTLVKERETVFMILETFSRMCFCLALGTVLADYAEKKTA